MMYGETGAEMRRAFATLLRRHRVQQKLGLTVEARQEHGVLVRQYRQTVLLWLAQAMRAASPLAFTNMPTPQPNPFQAVGVADAQPTAADELASALTTATTQSAARQASSDALSSPQSHPLVEQWRLAARAAALAEHDTAEPFAAQMTAPQARALVGDVAALAQALVVLDRRYKNTPGWEPLAGSARLGWAALAAALDVSLGQHDYAVDRIGWKPKTKLMTGPARPGILGVLQAQHNLVIRMKTVPNATNLRLVVDSQRRLSAHLVPFAARIDERLAARWSERADTYALIQRQLRDVAGVLGRGGQAAAEGAIAVARLRDIPPDSIVEPRVLAGFQLLFTRLDHRIADVIEDGVECGALAQRVTLPRLVAGSGQLIHPVRDRFVPVSNATDLEVIRTVRDRLRPREPVLMATPGATRVELHSAVLHRPIPRPRPGAPQI
ncbi:hypothetical protein [Nocardioides campestrisoli]|uniref:hypothetical protein n=1 Tax=Nocardioides campestrisoli TaxID=2736757 RepID=UPI00163D5F00|nr:hypothetical protein [Nocardioides campestrisoli]